jgi:hypothetical protein
MAEETEVTNKGGRPAKDTPPQTVAEVRALMSKELVRQLPDRFRLQGLSRLLDSLEADEQKAEKSAAALLPAVVTERDTLAARVAELEPLVAQVAELATLKADMDSWKAEQRKALVAEAERHSWDSQRAENRTKDTLAEAQEKFGQAGLQLLLDEVKKIVEQYNIPEPDPVRLPKGISCLYLTLWGRTPKYARVALAFAQFTEPTRRFKEELYKVLSVGLPVSPTVIHPAWDDENAETTYVYPKPDVIPDLAARREVLTAMAIKFGCLGEVQDRVNQRHAEILAQQHQENTASLQRQQEDLARMGYGRSEIAAPAPVSNVPVSEHVLGCCCRACGGNAVRNDSLEEVF